MAQNKIAAIAVDSPDEVASFYTWLARNRESVLGMSENTGCGCCVDIFYLELPDDIDPMPCESGGDFDESALRHGKDKEAAISEALDGRLGNTGTSDLESGGMAGR